MGVGGAVLNFTQEAPKEPATQHHCIVFAKMLTFLSSRQKIEQDLDKSSVLSFLVIHDNTIIATS